MFKLALNAGHWLGEPGKRFFKALDPNETREWVVNNRICTLVEKKLEAYEGYELLRIDDPTGNTDVPLDRRTSKANTWNADFYLSVHHNAGVYGGAGGGIMAYVYTSVDNTTRAWQKDLYEALVEETGLRGNRATPLASANPFECRKTSMPCVLLELGFMDSTTDVPIILSETYAEQCANAIVKVIVKRAGLKKKSNSTEVYESEIKKLKAELQILDNKINKIKEILLQILNNY